MGFLFLILYPGLLLLLPPPYTYHGFPSVHPVVIPVSLLPTRALPKLFPTASLPSTLSSFPHRSFPPELFPSYFPRLPFRPPCHHFRIVTPVSLLPTGALPKLFPTISLPSTLSSLPYRSFPPELQHRARRGLGKMLNGTSLGNFELLEARCPQPRVPLWVHYDFWYDIDDIVVYNCSKKI